MMKDSVLKNSTTSMKKPVKPQHGAWIEHLLQGGGEEDHDAGAPDGLPEVDEALVEQGNRYFRNNFFTLIISMLVGLHSILFFPSISRILVLTGKSGSKLLAFERYLRTVNHIVAWFQGTGALKTSLRQVLKLHRAASFLGKKSADRQLRSSGESSSPGITQLDMVVTQWGFVGPAILFKKELTKTGEGEDGFVYIFYLVGKALGIRDQFNLCQGTPEQIHRKCQLVLRQIIQPMLRANDEVAADLANHLLHGINILNPFLVQDNFRLLSTRLVLEEPLKEKGDSLYYDFTIFIFQSALVLPGSSLLRLLLNQLLHLNILIATECTEYIVQNTRTEGPRTAFDRLRQVMNIQVFIAMTAGRFLYKNIRSREKSLVLSLAPHMGILLTLALVWMLF